MDNKKEEIVEPEVITEVKEINKLNNNAIANIHNKLIQARHKLSLEEIRLMDTIISFIQPEDDDLKKYRIPVSIFKDLYESERKDTYDVVRRALEGLLSKPIKIESLNSKGKKVFEIFNFISYGRYEEGTGNFYVAIDSNFKPYLLKLKEFFTKIPIKYTYILKSRYSIRLYELLKQYEDTGFRVDKVEDLREMLGIENYEYSRFFDFEKFVLKQAVSEINEKTDIEVSYKKKKTGRKITHIEFTVKPKNANQGDTTQMEKSPSQSVDNKGQKKEVVDLWDTTLTILENSYNADPYEVDILRAFTYAAYKTDETPKIMVIKTDVEAEKGREKIREILAKYFGQIKEIVRIESNGNYIPKISKSVMEKGKETSF